MDLFLWRHAEAADAREGQDDLERALTGKGERQAARMAAWLQPRLPAGTRVLASPARRTRQTAEALGLRWSPEPALAPGATPEAVLAAAHWPDGRGPVLLVGHQPTLGLAASLALAGRAQPWSIRKGAVWWLRSRAPGQDGDGRGPVLLVAVVGPELA